jgi:hypothetical protein
VPKPLLKDFDGTSHTSKNPATDPAQGSADPVVKGTAMNQSNLRHKKSIYRIFLNVQQVHLREQLIVDGAFI